MRFNSSGDDALREVPRILLQRFNASGFEHRDIVVINRGGLDEDFFLGHRHQQPGFGDAARPFLAKLCPVLPQMSYELGQESLCAVFITGHHWWTLRYHRGSMLLLVLYHCVSPFLLSARHFWLCPVGMHR